MPKNFSWLVIGCLSLIILAILLVILGSAFSLTAFYFLGVVSSTTSVSLGILSLRENQ